jgi:SOS-response transcriptional repressor LexA
MHRSAPAQDDQHDRIQLLPLNPAFEPITLEPEDAENLMVVGEFQGSR